MILKFIESFLVLFCYFVHIRLEKINWCALWNFYLFEKKKSTNPNQMYPHIIESYACILKIFVVIFLLPINFLNFFGTLSMLNSMKVYQNILLFTYKATQWLSIDWYLSRYIKYGPSFNLGKLFLKLFLEFH